MPTCRGFVARCDAGDAEQRAVRDNLDETIAEDIRRGSQGADVVVASRAELLVRVSVGEVERHVAAGVREDG